jgi:hypothetical protein
VLLCCAVLCMFVAVPLDIGSRRLLQLGKIGEPVFSLFFIFDFYLYANNKNSHDFLDSRLLQSFVHLKTAILNTTNNWPHVQQLLA